MAEAEIKEPNLEQKSGGEGAADNKPDAGADTGADGGGDDFSNFQPEVRKTPADYFRERQSSRTESPSKEGEGGGEGAGEPATMADLKTEVERQVRERLQPYEQVVVNSANESEIASYLGSHEDYRKYVSVVRKFMDAYKGITAENAFLLAEARFGNPAERGAEEEKRRQQEGKKARGGTSPRPTARTGGGEISAEEIQSMTSEQFAAFNERIKGGAQVKT